jgi:site-specific recombinase XerD
MRRNGAQRGDTYVAASEQVIDRFLDAAWMERGLSRNTLSAYRTDLVALARWVAEQGGRSRRLSVATSWRSSPVVSKAAPGRAHRRASVELPSLLPLAGS